MCRTANGKISKKSLRRLRRLYKGQCQYCFINPGDTFDHIVPLAKKGKNNLGNIIVACRRCNEEKDDERLPLAQEVEMLRRADEARTYVISRHTEAFIRLNRWRLLALKRKHC